MVKFPGGTPGRWEKIAHELGRSVADVSHLDLHCTLSDKTDQDRQCKGNIAMVRLCLAKENCSPF